LSERLARLAPPEVAASLARGVANPPLPRPSPAVAAALASSQIRADRVARNAERPKRSRSMFTAVVESFIAACAFIPYALIALGLRFVMARVFFLSGQDKVEGLRLPLTVQDFDLSVILPLQIKTETFTAFLTSYSQIPVQPVLAAYLVSAAEFVLPICLVLGFATRFAALGLLIMTAIIQLYVLPEALWTAHVYWLAILTVLLTRGAGEISVDHIIRHVMRRSRS
jgi:putative oxidoreductase